jgi:hypothetical protein
MMSLFRQLHSQARGAIFRIVRMGSEDDDAQLAVARWLERGGLRISDPWLLLVQRAKHVSQPSRP